MATCQQCFPWNTPLLMRPVYVVDADYVPLSFGQWLLYRLHVQMHQHNNWAGELDNKTVASHNPSH